MLRKLLLAVTITFSLNFFLAVDSSNTSTTASRSHLAKTPSELVKLLFEQGLWGKSLLPPSGGS